MLARVDRVGQQQLADEDRRAEQHQRVDAKRLDQPVGYPRARHRAERGAEADDHEQALALFLGVDVVGEGPELRDDHQAEDADPDEEHDGERHAKLREDEEDHRARGERHRDDIDQLHAAELRHQPSVERNDESEHHDLTGGQIALELGRALAEDQRLAHRLEDVVGHQDQEHVQAEEQGGGRLALADLGEQVQEPLNPAAGCLRGDGWHLRHARHKARRSPTFCRAHGVWGGPPSPPTVDAAHEMR